MTDPHTSDDTDQPPARPIWVKAFVLTVLVLVALFLLLQLLGIDHGPSRHAADDASASRPAPISTSSAALLS